MELTFVLLAEWSGALMGLTGSFLVALGGGRERWGFVLYLGANIAISGFALATHAWGLLAMQVGFTLSTSLGLWRCFVSARRVEDRYAIAPELVRRHARSGVAKALASAYHGAMKTIRHAGKTAVKFVTPSGVTGFVAVPVEANLLQKLIDKMQRRLDASAQSAVQGTVASSSAKT